MRSHGGGWHANTAKVCFGLSIIYYLTVVFVSERLSDTFDNLWFMALISAIIILLSPVDSINKRNNNCSRIDEPGADRQRPVF